MTAIFHARPDVVAYFPNAVQDFRDEGFMYWLMNQGAKELGIEDLCQRFKRYLYETNIVEDVIKVLKKRTDVTAAYPNFVSDRQSYQGLCGWLENSGVKEEKLNATKLEAFKKARGGYYKVLNLYFLRPDLQLAFCNIHLPEIRASFIEWLKSNLTELQNLDLNECLWFDCVCEQQPDKITIVNLLYNCQIRKLMGGDASLFELDKLLQMSGLAQNQEIKKAVIEFFVSPEAPPPLSQLEAFYKSQGILNHLFPKAFESREKLSQFFDYIKEHSSLHSLPLQVKAVAKWLDQLDQEINKYDPTNTQVVNVAGHLAKI